MDYETQAQNGFKTFIVTLVVSLIAFSAIYYLVADVSGNVDIESGGDQAMVQTPQQQVASSQDSKPASVFEEISQKPVDSKASMVAVLGAADESTESTVPNTGSETLVGTMLAGAFFSVALYFLLVGPRKLAIQGFENDVLKKS
uniref:Uncharacterized protein n=1 Tax=candidate division WWE3 bacterium TaxID=2053526 RepID=A0A7C4TP11_UNCKA